MTKLIPVSEWRWHLFKVSYHVKDGEPAELVKYIVTTDTHIEGEIFDGATWPSPSYDFARWEPAATDVARPRQVGTIYGKRLDETGWCAGEREAKQRGLK